MVSLGSGFEEEPRLFEVLGEGAGESELLCGGRGAERRGRGRVGS